MEEGDVDQASDEVESRVTAILRRPYRRVTQDNPEGAYLAEAPDLEGGVTATATDEEAIANLHEAMAPWMESALADGVEIPEPAARREVT